MESEGINNPPLSLRQAFTEACPYYMALGMSFSEYWHKEPWRTLMYLKAAEIKNHTTDTNMWVQGRYIYDAICSTAPILNAFSKEHKARPYRDKPFHEYEKESAVSETDGNEKTLDERKAEAEEARAMLFMLNMRREYAHKQKQQEPPK